MIMSLFRMRTHFNFVSWIFASISNNWLITLKLECIVPVLLVKWYELVKCVWNFNSHDRNIGVTGDHGVVYSCLTAPSHRLNRCWLILIVMIALGLLEANELYDEKWQFRRKWGFSCSAKVFSVVCDNFTARCKLAHLCCADPWVIVVFCLTLGKYAFYVLLCLWEVRGYWTYCIIVFFCIYWQFSPAHHIAWDWSNLISFLSPAFINVDVLLYN